MAKKKVPPVAAYEALRAELNKPLTMHQSLKKFTRKVYKDRTLMSGTTIIGQDVLATKIYSLYSGEGQTPVDYRSWETFIKLLYSSLKQKNMHTNAFLPNTKRDGKTLTLPTLIQLISQRKEVVPEAYFRDFIQCNVMAWKPTHRVYANVKTQYVSNVIKEIPTGGFTAVTAFKVCGPAVIESRRDTITVYFSQKDSAWGFARKLAEDRKKRCYFRSERPALTEKVKSGVGIGVGAQPEGTAAEPTGLGRTAGKGQSFGTIRSELIAAAILNFHANKHHYGDTLEVFQRFVAVAFRGAGLDPTRPAD